MKRCAACQKEFSKENFSKKQWQLKQHQRRCKQCVATNKNILLEQEFIADAAPTATTTTTTYQTAANDEGITCWICLCEEDETCQLPLRDCSCRGDAGFAHFSCISKYAEIRSKEAAAARYGLEDDSVKGFVEPWGICTGCKQCYQHDLALDLAHSLLVFLDEQFTPKRDIDYIRTAEALRLKIRAIRTLDCKDNLGIRKEGIKAAYQIISITEDINPYHLPQETSDTITRQDMITLSFAEIHAHQQLSYFFRMEETKEAFMKQIRHHKFVRDIYQQIGYQSGVKEVEACIALVEATHFGLEAEKSSQVTLLKCLRTDHDEAIGEMGENSREAIMSGLSLASVLIKIDYGIESERLLVKLAPISLRVHGVDHRQTQNIESNLWDSKRRIVGFSLGDEILKFQALRYVAGSDKCVIKGPVDLDKGTTMNDDEDEDGSILTVEHNSLFLFGGMPVICYGLKKQSRLNGRLGDCRKWCEESGRYQVHFEDKSLKSVEVKVENLRIVFDLPDAKE